MHACNYACTSACQNVMSGTVNCCIFTVAHMISKWEGLLEDAAKMQRQLMRNTTVVFAFIEVKNFHCCVLYIT